MFDKLSVCAFIMADRWKFKSFSHVMSLDVEGT